MAGTLNTAGVVAAVRQHRIDVLALQVRGRKRPEGEVLPTQSLLSPPLLRASTHGRAIAPLSAWTRRMCGAAGETPRPFSACRWAWPQRFLRPGTCRPETNDPTAPCRQLTPAGGLQRLCHAWCHSAVRRPPRHCGLRPAPRRRLCRLYAPAVGARAHSGERDRRARILRPARTVLRGGPSCPGQPRQAACGCRLPTPAPGRAPARSTPVRRRGGRRLGRHLPAAGACLDGLDGLDGGPRGPGEETGGQRPCAARPAWCPRRLTRPSPTTAPCAPLGRRQTAAKPCGHCSARARRARLRIRAAAEGC